MIPSSSWAPHVVALPFDAAAFGGVAYVQFVAACLNDWWFFAPRLAGNKTLAAAMIVTSPLTGMVAAYGTHRAIMAFFT